MLRNFFLSGFVFFLGISGSFAQIGTGQWRMHIPNSKAIDIAAGNGFAVAALTSGVISYDIAAGEYHLYDNMNGLSDIKVSCIAFHDPSNSFLVGYENGNMDQILSNGNIQSIPGIYLSNILGDKRINDIESHGNYMYVSTGFGLVVVDPVKHEIKDTYYPGSSAEPILDASFLNDTIFALTATKCYRGALSNNFLADAAQWTTDIRFTTPPNGQYSKIAIQQNELHVLYNKTGYGGDSIYRVTNSGLEMKFGAAFDMELLDFDVVDDYFSLTFDIALILYNEDNSVFKYIGDYGQYDGAPRAVASYGNVFWVADNNMGLVRYQDEYNYRFISTEGPPKDQFFALNGFDDKIVVTSGVLDRVNFTYRRDGAYTFQDEKWKLYDQNSQSLWFDNFVWDISSSAVNQVNTDQFALGSYAIHGLSIVNGDSVTAVYSDSNSILETSSLGNGNVCISALEYDEFGNLWICNGYSNDPLKALLADGTWKSYNTGTLPKSKYTTKLAIDFNNMKWFGVYGVGLVGYDDNGTPAVTTDDTYKILGTGEGNGNLPSDAVTAIACDFDNEIWIGTENGFVVLYNSEGLFSSSGVIDATKILVNFEGNVEDLLGGTPISDIEIDGGNRKWIATASTGIFLLSADGQEVIAQYTKENSPLISNNILDMEFNQTNGELFIVTDLGLVSLRTDASYEDPDYKTTTVFPNPVKPEYTGPITIQGIRYNSDVKITDIAGNLVYQTTSNGGTATWNGKTLSGENVASGVYMIWTATNTGKDKKVGKVTVIR